MAWLPLGLLAACGMVEETGTPPTDDLLALRANAWEWAGVDNGSGVQPVENSANYRLMFNRDASLAVAADCNSAAGSYQVNEINGNALTIEIKPVTAAACPEGSRSGEFIAMLPSAQSLSFDDGKLRIVASGETGPVTMVFAPSDQGVALPQSAATAGTSDPANTLDDYQYVLPFDLGDTVLVQAGQTDERNREMPVRLNGLIAAPPEGDNLPLAIIIHGSHGSGCNSSNGLTEDWPCPAQEKAHYNGFAYLIEALAERGYVAMSINANPAFVAAYGDVPSTVRLPILFDLYLEKIAAAARGEDIGLPVNLTGRVDLSQLVVFGHSAGGEGTTWVVDNRAGHNTPEEISAGHGRIAAAILLAPTFYATQQAAMALPFAVLLPACDRDVTGLDGQNYYEDAREQVERETLAASIFLRGANHNRFNSQLEDETLGRGSSVCEDALLPVEDHQMFLKRYVAGFFDAVLPGKSNPDTGAIGLDATTPAPDMVFGYPVLTSLALPANQRLILPLDGSGITGPATAVTCQRGYFQPEDKREPCKHGIIIQPGYPEQVAITWEGAHAAYEVRLPAGGEDVSAHEMLHLRASVDPTTPLNLVGDPQAFSIRLTDGSGNSAAVAQTGEPALAFPAGETWGDGVTTFWDTPVVLSSIRVPLSAFEGVDLTDLRSVALVFDSQPRGAVFVTDLEFLKKDENDMTQSTTSTSDTDKPAYVADLEASYGPPSQEGFGSAVFYEQLAVGADLEAMAKKYYRHFVGDLWEKWGEAKWLGPWQQVYARDPNATRDIVAELRGIADPKAHVSVPMILDELENADKARQALAVAFNASGVNDLRVYSIGDGEQMSGLIVAGQRTNGEATFLVFLLD
jgi:heat shock protein HslJ